MSNDEWQLIRQFVDGGSQAAFAELVGRYARLVNGRCLRQLGDVHAADDVSQVVWLVLATRAYRLAPDLPLDAWLYRVTAFACRNEVKMRDRRKRHEVAAAQLAEALLPDKVQEDWSALAPLLDTAIDRLAASDRQAVLMRYFENRSVREVAASLGLTENTAGRRLLRALGKLRKSFAARGITVPAMAIGSAVTAVIAGTAEPSARAAVPPSVVSQATRADARAALRGLRWEIFKPFAVAAFVAVVGLGGLAGWIAGRSQNSILKILATPLAAVVPPAVTPPAIATVDPVETQLPGVAQLAQWDLLLDDVGYEAMRGIGRSVDTPSKLYQARRCDAGQLRRALDDAITAGGAIAVSHQSHQIQLPQPVYDGKRYTEQFHPNLQVNEPGNFIWFSGTSMIMSDEFDRLPDGRVGLRLRHPDLNAGIADEPYHNLARPPGGNGITFDGFIAPGETLAFVARFVGQSGAVYYHLIAWESFRATPVQAAVFDFPTDAGWWCEHGPEQLRLWADLERIWSDWTGFGRPWGAPSIERKLSDGESVWLFALCRPSDYPFCWWDPQGKPAPPWQGGVPMDGAPPSGLWAQIGVTRPMNRMAYASAPDDGNGEQDQLGDSQIESKPIDVSTKSLTVGVPVGPWTEVARLRYGQPMTVGGVRYEIAPDKEHGEPWNQLTRTGVLDDQMHVVAVHRDGSRHRFEVGRDLKWSEPGISGKVTDLVWADGSPDQVDYFSIRLRKREFVTFNGFAIDPALKPPTHLTRAETDARLSQISGQHLQRCLDQLPRQRTGYFFYWFGPKLDDWNGGMKFLLGATIAHDEPTVRRMLSASGKPASDALDALAHLMTRGEMIRSAVAGRFGEPAAHELLDKPGLFEDLEAELMGVGWSGMLDTQQHVHPYTDMESNDSWLGHVMWKQGPTGDYTLNVDDLFPQPGAVDELKARCRFADKVYKLVSQKRTVLTLNDLRRKLQEPGRDQH